MVRAVEQKMESIGIDLAIAKKSSTPGARNGTEEELQIRFSMLETVHKTMRKIMDEK